MRLQTRSFVTAGVVEIYDNAIPNCADLLRIARSSGRWNDAMIGAGQGVVSQDRRDNKVVFFDPADMTVPIPFYHLGRTVWHYLNDYGKRYSFAFSAMEPMNVNWYKPGEQYHAHSDDGPGHNRVVSALVYLNTVSEGGGTRFTFFDETISAVEGRLVIFPSNYAYTHEALPPVSNDKYSVAIWARRI